MLQYTIKNISIEQEGFHCLGIANLENTLTQKCGIHLYLKI